MTMKFDRLVELVETLPADSKAMLRILQRANPMRRAELHTRSVFDVGRSDISREQIIKDLIDRGLVEECPNRFDVELVRLTPGGRAFLDIMDTYIYEGPDTAEAFRWM